MRIHPVWFARLWIGACSVAYPSTRALRAAVNPMRACHTTQITRPAPASDLTALDHLRVAASPPAPRPRRPAGFGLGLLPALFTTAKAAFFAS